MTHHRYCRPGKTTSFSIIPLALCVLLASGTASCGTDAITSEDDAIPTTPICAQGESAVAGILDGLQVSERITSSYHVFINKLGAGPGTFDTDQGGVAVHLEWGVLLASGQSTPARGWVRGAGFDVGNPPDATFSGTLSLDDVPVGLSGQFLLKELHHTPYGSGVAVRGAVAGCFRYN